MSRRTRDEEGRAFERAMRGVERIEQGPRRGSDRFRRTGPPEAAQEQRFEITQDGLNHWGRHEDVPAADLETLLAGKVEPANRLDLHGMSEEAARGRVFRFVRQASQSGLRCVSIVHGRGMRSPDGPVLKQAVPRWLTQLPLARHVAAFASAPRERGGDGVTLILLRP